MQAGKLDRRATLQTKSTAQDSSGEELGTPTTIGTVWASKADLTGREFLNAQAVHAEVTTRFQIRWRSDVEAEVQIVCEGLTYDVLSVAEIGRREGLELLCKRTG